MIHNHVSNLFLKQTDTIHFSGIGGIGMSGIAEILHNIGFDIQGSDVSENANTDRLKDLGIKIYIGQKAENLDNVSFFVKSTAILENNPEYIQARKLKIPIITRTEMLAELMRLKISIAISGTHGKTTTTSLVAALFENADLNPTVINGGIINHKKTNAYLGEGDFLIAEADESDETFIKVPSTIGVITNIDPEHLDHYKTFDNLKDSFRKFIANLPFYGFAVLCIDHPVVDEIAKSITNRKIITYSMSNKESDIFVDNIRHDDGIGTVFDVIISDKVSSPYKSIKNIRLPIPGLHNVSNSLAAIAIASELKFDQEKIVSSFEKFMGVKRRFTLTGEYKGIKIIDDYAHHPEEIKVTLHTAKLVANKHGGKVIAIFQPHRYTRTKNLFNDFVKCFKDCDRLYIADIYSAGEKPITNINNELVVNAIKQSGSHKCAFTLPKGEESLKNIVKTHARKNDIVIFMGAGSITKWANELPDKLKSSD